MLGPPPPNACACSFNLSVIVITARRYTHSVVRKTLTTHLIPYLMLGPPADGDGGPGLHQGGGAGGGGTVLLYGTGL